MDAVEAAVVAAGAAGAEGAFVEAAAALVVAWPWDCTAPRAKTIPQIVHRAMEESRLIIFLD